MRFVRSVATIPGDPSYLLDMLHGFDHGRLVLLNGEIVAHRVVIPVSEATAAFGTSKPVSGDWFGRRASKPTAPRAQVPSHGQPGPYKPTQEGENHERQ